QYADLAPAGLVLACGLFGNMTDADIEQTIGFCTQLCATGGTVVWTRGRWDPDLVPQVCAWFEERGFERVWLSESRYGQCCGAHRFTGAPAPLERGAVMFAFTDHDIQRGPHPPPAPGTPPQHRETPAANAPSWSLAQSCHHDGLDGVQPVFGLIEDDAGGRSENLTGNLQAIGGTGVLHDFTAHRGVRI